MLSWWHLVPTELYFISNLELTNAFFLWKCLLSVQLSHSVVCDSLQTQGFPVHHHLPELAQTHVHGVGDASNHLILHRPLLLLPSIFPSIRIFSNESGLCIRWPKYWSFSISPPNEYSELTSFSIDWFDFPEVSKVFSSTTVQKYQFFGAQPSLWSNSHIHTWLLGKP